jgi:hypothetical protein
MTLLATDAYHSSAARQSTRKEKKSLTHTGITKRYEVQRIEQKSDS